MLIIKTKLLFVEKTGIGEQLRECMTDFYFDLANDIETLSRMHPKRDKSTFQYIFKKLRDKKSANSVAF